MSGPKFLLDVNVVLALGDEDHTAHRIAMKWFSTPGLDWGLCPFSEGGYFRLATNPMVGKLSIGDAAAILTSLTKHPGYRFWPINSDWMTLVRPILGDIIGHQQVPDAHLLGLAIQGNGILVTLDKGIRHLAGPTYSKHLLVLE